MIKLNLLLHHLKRVNKTKFITRNKSRLMKMMSQIKMLIYNRYHIMMMILFYKIKERLIWSNKPTRKMLLFDKIRMLMTTLRIRIHQMWKYPI